ncbi:MAG: hypothetical protein J6M17_10610 [Ruminococcus sp.]|nr:hypothetical protein [Ruminococcus sp.]
MNKKNLMITVVIAALSLASCSDISVPVQEEVAAAVTTSPAVSAPSETTQAKPEVKAESAPDENDSKKPAFTTANSVSSSSDPVQEERERLKNTTITANVPVTVKAPGNADDNSVLQNDDSSSRPIRINATFQNGSIAMLSDLEEIAAGKDADLSVFYNSDFEVTDNIDECAYYKLDSDFINHYEGNIQDLIDTYTAQYYTDSFIASYGIADKLRNNLAGHNGSIYIHADKVTNDYMIYTLVNEDDIYSDPYEIVGVYDRYTFEIRVSSANGTDYGIHDATLISSDGYNGKLDSIN